MKVTLKYIILLCILVSGCSKVELPDATLGDPVFIVSGTVDGEAFDFQAGVKDYYLFTDVITDAPANIPVYRGTLKDVNNCGDPCPRSLSLEFRNDSLSTAPISNLLEEGEKQIWTSSSDTQGVDAEVTFENLSSASSGSTYFWDFGAGQSSVLEDPGTIAYKLDLSTSITASLVVTSATGNCTSNYSIPISSSSSDCVLSLDEDSAPASLEFCANMIGVAPFNYSWNVAGVSQNTACVTVPTDTMGLAVLNVVDATGCKDSMTLRFEGDLGQPTEYCAAKFRISKYKNNSVEDLSGFGKVNIVYVDQNGISYESVHADYNSIDNFNILSSELYDDNENGKATIKFTFEYNGDVATEAGEKIRLENVIGTWAIAIE